MLSPVSPSATGKTLRSLTSWRRDSRCASAPATAARKRTRLVSVTATRLSACATDTRPPGRMDGDLLLAAARLSSTAGRRALGSECLGDLAGLQATGADV